MNKRRRGTTLLELMVAGMIALTLGAGLFLFFESGYNSESFIMDHNNSTLDSRHGIDLITDGWKDPSSGVNYPGLMGATSLASGTGPNVLIYNCVDSSGTSHVVQYWVSNGNLVRSVDGAPNNGTVVIQNVNNLSLNYWTWNGSSWVSSTNPGTPANVGAVDYQLTSNVDNQSVAMSGSVRIREIRCTISSNGDVF
jgi:hypothetical protein